MPPELQRLLDELDAADRDAKAVANGLDEQQGTWRPSPGAWSVAECLDHLAVSNRIYLVPLRQERAWPRAGAHASQTGAARPHRWLVRHYLNRRPT